MKEKLIELMNNVKDINDGYEQEGFYGQQGKGFFKEQDKKYRYLEITLDDDWYQKKGARWFEQNGLKDALTEITDDIIEDMINKDSSGSYIDKPDISMFIQSKGYKPYENYNYRHPYTAIIISPLSTKLDPQEILHQLYNRLQADIYPNTKDFLQNSEQQQ